MNAKKNASAMPAAKTQRTDSLRSTAREDANLGKRQCHTARTNQQVLSRIPRLSLRPASGEKIARLKSNDTT